MSEPGPHSDDSELEQLERELATEETKLDAQWLHHEGRLQVLGELHDYLIERQMTLRTRATRMSLPAEEIDELFGAGGELPSLQQADVTQSTLSMERESLTAERRQLCERRRQAVDARRTLLESAAQIHETVERALLEREQQLAGAFRTLITRAGELAGETGASESFEDSEARNRRRFRRIEVCAYVDFATDHNFIAARTANLSIGGVFLATRNLLQQDREVELQLTLPGAGRLDLRGVVSWRRTEDGPEGPPGLGIQFTHLTDETRAAIDTFAAQRDPIEV